LGERDKENKHKERYIEPETKGGRTGSVLRERKINTEIVLRVRERLGGREVDRSTEKEIQSQR
jgi:hypothetical protein